MLAQRFTLVSHYEEQPRAAHALVLARADGRPGPELRKYPFDCAAYLEQQGPQTGATPPPPASGAPSCGNASDTGVIRSGGVTMATLARMVAGPVGRRVIDRTGLPGHYDFTLTFAPRTAAPSAALTDDAPSIVTALQEQLGLKRNPEQALSQVVVIDSISKPEPD